jgi:Phage gp6-like head-tail connector protein
MAAGDLTTLADVKAWLNTTGTFGSTDDAILTRLITAASSFIARWLGRDVVMTNYSELRDGLGGCSASFVFANFPVSQVYAVVVGGVAIPPIAQTSGTLTTNGPTASGNPTLNFAKVPSWVVAGMTITDPATANAILAQTTVQSTTPTTVVMSQGAGSAGVLSGDLIVFAPSPGGVVIPQIASFYPPAGYTFTPTRLVISGYRVPRLPQSVALLYQAGYATVPNEIAQACIELVATRYKLERQHPGVVADHIGTAAGDGVTYTQKDMNANMATALQQFRAVAPVSAMPRGY